MRPILRATEVPCQPQPMNLRRALPILFVAAFVTGAAVKCATTQNLVQDVKTCFGPDVKMDEQDILTQLGQDLSCDVAAPAAVPACALTSLVTLAEEIGPNGKTDLQCVIHKMATSVAADAALKPGADPKSAVSYRRAKYLDQNWPAELSWNDGARGPVYAAACRGHGAPGLVGGGGG